MRGIFISSIIGFVATVAESTSLQPTYNVATSFEKDKGWMIRNNTRKEDNESIVAKGAITPRTLLFIPRKASLHVRPPTLPTKKCQQSFLRQREDCETIEYAIFSQSYMPTLMTTGKQKFLRQVKPEEVDDWNNKLKIHGLWSHRSKVLKSTLPFTLEAKDEVNQHEWPVILKIDRNHRLYAEEWRDHGVESGLTPVDYIREINRLHQSHSTPPVISETTRQSVSLVELKKGFHPSACLMCKTRKEEKLFMGVQYCHKVNSKSRKLEQLVPYKYCGRCASRTPCNQERIVIPKLKETTTSCHSGTCKENEYTIFAQSYMPTVMTTGRFYRQVEPNEVDDWNSNLKIHGLWPIHYKVKTSTLSFTPHAATAVDKNAWPSIRHESYEYQWEAHGVHTGLEPLEYVYETQRVHQLHPTPDLLKGVFPNQQTIPLATLKKLFDENACLLCRPQDGKELFLAMRLCHKVNSKTREMDKVVPFNNCGVCSTKPACSQNTIVFPKIKIDNTREVKFI